MAAVEEQKKLKSWNFSNTVIDESSYDPFLNQNPTKPFRKTEDLDNNCGDKGRNHKATKKALIVRKHVPKCYAIFLQIKSPHNILTNLRFTWPSHFLKVSVVGQTQAQSRYLPGQLHWLSLKWLPPSLFLQSPLLPLQRLCDHTGRYTDIITKLSCIDFQYPN